MVCALAAIDMVGRRCGPGAIRHVEEVTGWHAVLEGIVFHLWELLTVKGALCSSNLLSTLVEVFEGMVLMVNLCSHLIFYTSMTLFGHSP
jgi:hypothetical protein